MDFDPEKLQSIIANLLSNALKFTPEEGNVKLEAEILSSLVPQPGKIPPSNLLKITVSDTGIGIAEEQLPYVFDRFYHPP
ncbi:MAG: ATP-binding protein [Phaeodactylibacter sp.]|nr:ATP-binding protein [Phaeodactylibacter sp.]